MSLAANSLLIHFSMLLEMKTSGNILNHVSQLLAVRRQVQVHFICFSSMRSWRDRGGFAWEGSRESFQGSLFPWFPMVELQSVSKRARECYVHWGRLRDTIIIKVFSNWLSMSTKKKKKIRMDTVTSPRWRSRRSLATLSYILQLLGCWEGWLGVETFTDQKKYLKILTMVQLCSSMSALELCAIHPGFWFVF